MHTYLHTNKFLTTNFRLDRKSLVWAGIKLYRWRKHGGDGGTCTRSLICSNARSMPPFKTDIPVYNGHPWDHAKWLLYRGGLLIEVGGALGSYRISGWSLGLILLAGMYIYRG